MAGQRDVAVQLLHAEVERVRKRVFLRLEALAAALLDELLDIHGDRFETHRTQRFRMQRTHLGADADAFAIGRRADRAHPVRHVPKAVVPEAERAKRRLLAHAIGEERAERPLQSTDGGRTIAHDERKLEDPQLRHVFRKPHGRHVACRELSVLHHARQITRFAAEREDVADELEFDSSSELALEHFTEARGRARVDRRWTLIAAEAEIDLHASSAVRRSTIAAR
jgi:hypothetical protein